MWTKDDYAISRPVWKRISELLQPGMVTLEFGSGFSTVLFSLEDVQHKALESHEYFYMRTQQYLKYCGNGSRVELLFCPIVDGWYDWEPEGTYDLILIDGPIGSIGREGVLKHIGDLVRDNTIIIVDDVHRAAEEKLARTIIGDTDKETLIVDRAAFIFEE